MIILKFLVNNYSLVLLIILQLISTNLFAQETSKFTSTTNSISSTNSISLANTSRITTDDSTKFLIQDSVILDEIVVFASRVNAKSETDKAVYFINYKLLSATGNTINLLSHIPGVQVDLKQNISIDGNSNILLFVDGKERDKSYVSQLTPSQIARVEVVSTPPSNYDGDASGVINIVLKKQKTTGLSGHIFTEIPMSKSIVYLFPTYSLNYSYNKINLYTSYNGEINYEDLDEVTVRQIFKSNSSTNISSVQQVRQRNLSHKFHYSIDYHLNDRDIINFYGFYNQYSYEQNGNVVVQANGNFSNDWEAQKEENDLNRSSFNSLYYKHLFNDKGSEIDIDISNANSRSENMVTLTTINTVDETQLLRNTENPHQTSTSLKIDFSNPFNENLKLSTGLKVKSTDMHDVSSDKFSYSQNTSAVYGAINYKKQRMDLHIGLRFENAKTELNNKPNKSLNTLLPYIAVNYKVNDNNINLSFRSSINRPSVYMLNKYTYTDDPYTIRKGNPLLKLEMINRFQLEHSIRFKSNYISTRLFYESISDDFSNLTYLSDKNLNNSYIFVTQPHNLGAINQYGLQINGVLTMGKSTISPSFRLYNQSTLGNSLAKQYGIEDKNNHVFEYSVSSILSFKNDFALSFIFQYETAKENIQDNTYDEALYFITIDKTFKKNFKVGIVSALPFKRNFIYQGSKIYSTDFSSSYIGNLKLPTVPLMFRVNYLFNTGKNRDSIKREKESIEIRPKKGFI